jgi:hypothetical protein
MSWTLILSQSQLLSKVPPYFQPCYFCANLVETIILPSAILASSNVFVQWQQIGHKDPTVPGSIRFSNHDGLVSMHFNLSCQDGLYYCDSDVYTVDNAPVHVQCQWVVPTAPLLPRPSHRPPLKFTLTTRTRQVESEVWVLCFGSPGEHQLNVLPRHVIGMLPLFEYHPFRSIDFKEQVYIQKQPAGKSAERIASRGTEFFMDLGFMHASTNDYHRPNRDTDCIVTSYDGYCTYLLIVDSASQWTWSFLTSNKEPPIAICTAFLRNFGNSKGIIRCNQGSELSRSATFISAMLDSCGYIVEPTGADSASQNGGAE